MLAKHDENYMPPDGRHISRGNRSRESLQLHGFAQTGKYGAAFSADRASHHIGGSVSPRHQGHSWIVVSDVDVLK